MTSQEHVERGGLGGVGPARTDRPQQGEEVLAGRDREAIRRDADDVVLSAVGQTKLDRHAADASDGGVRIGRVWYTARIGEADCQRRGRAFEEDGGAEPICARRGHERALEHGTRGMVGTSAWMRPVKCIHLIDQSSSKRLFLGPGRAATSTAARPMPVATIRIDRMKTSACRGPAI